MAKKQEEDDGGPDPREVDKYIKQGQRVCKDLEAYGKDIDKILDTAEELEKVASEESEQPSV